MMPKISLKNLYQPDKYQVHIGEGSIGFCTAWNEAKAAIAKEPQLLKKSALVGTLYSAQGVNVIVRNLALNPHIRKLYVWGNGALSNTKFGVIGTGILKKIWSEGVAADGTVKGTNFKLHKEIDLKVLSEIVNNVELIDVSRDGLQPAAAKVKPAPAKPYMKPVRFADARLEVPDTFPSEEIGWLVRGRYIVDTWTRVVERIMRFGTVKGTQYGSQQKELIGVTWVVHDEDPFKPQWPSDWPQELREITSATPDAIKEYHQVFLSPKMPSGVSYTYGNRLMRYPSGKSYLDQIKTAIIRNLKASPDSRRAVATTLVPPIDAKSDEPPCITQLQALQANGRLNFLVTVRSHDIFKAAIPNAFGLRTLQARVARETGFEMGALQITSQSAHIYETDWENAKKLAACSFWERPPRVMTGDDADPRGRFLIRLEKKQIVVEYQGANGATLLEFRNESADALVREIAKHELFSQTEHSLDIGVQLARAEVALRLNKRFVQDRKINF